MKTVLVWILGLGLVFARTSQACEVAVYAYDSLLSKSGWGTAAFALYEKQTGCRVRATSVGDSGQLVTRLALDARAKRASAQLVIGVDQQVWGRVREWVVPSRAFKAPRWTADVAELLRGGKLLEEGFVPFDAGIFALMSDSQAGAPPSSWRALLDPKWKRKLLLQDPRTSTPGLAFILGSREVFGGEWLQKSRAMSAQWLTLTPGWDQAYGMFLKGDAPLVWSYTTSQAYHVEHGKTDAEKTRYRAVVFEEGNPVQLEGAALVASGVVDPEKRVAAEKLLQFLVSKEAQALIPTHNWMFPASAEAPLPKSFAELPRPKRLLPLSYDPVLVEKTLREWLVEAQRGTPK